MRLSMIKNTILGVILLVLAACSSGPSVSSVTVSPSLADLTVGGSVQLSASVKGSSGTSKVVTWTSDNDSVASVDDIGNVTGKGTGTAIITATSSADKTKKGKATINVASSITAVTTSPTSVLLSTSGTTTAQLSATVEGTGTFSPDVTWASDSDPNDPVATVDNTGLVTAKKVGTATITATSVENTAVSGTVSVQVVDKLTLSNYADVAATAGQLASVNATTTAAGGSPPYTFTLIGTPAALPAGLALDAASGSITGKPTAVSATATYTIQVKDALNATATATVKITVNAAPAFAAAAYNNGNLALTAGTAFTSAAPSVTGGTTPMKFTVAPNLPAGMAINKDTGVITADATTVATPSATYVVTATDNNGVAATKNVIIVINSGVGVAFTQVRALTAGKAIVAANYTLTASGGTAPYTFTATGLGGSGLTLSTAGVFAGTPTTAGAINFNITAKDANNAAVTIPATFTVNTAPTFTTPYATPIVLTANQPSAFTSTTPVVTGGTGTPATPYTVAPALPAGLALSGATGVISGTPTAASAATTYTVTYTDANGAKTTAPINITVNAAPTIPATSYNSGVLTLTAGTVFTSAAPATTGGTPTLLYSVSPALPAGMSINANTGVISGDATTVPTAGAVYVVTITDANAKTATINVTIAINFTLSYSSPATVSNATVADGDTVASPTVSGGTGTITYTRTNISGNFGPNFSFSGVTGVITAKNPPLAIGSYVMTITATDSIGAKATFTLTITVGA